MSKVTMHSVKIRVKSTGRETVRPVQADGLDNFKRECARKNWEILVIRTYECEEIAPFGVKL